MNKMTCRHYEGPRSVEGAAGWKVERPTRCAAGIEYSTLNDTPLQRPCLNRGVGCSKGAPYTAEEIAANEARIRASLNRIGKAREAILKATGNRRGVSGSVTCPTCGGVLRYSVAKCNGHIHAACSGDCHVSWME